MSQLGVFSLNKYFLISAMVLGSAAAQAQGQPPAQAAPVPPPAAAAAPPAVSGPRPTKVGYLNLQQAVLATAEGQKASGDLNAKYAPKKADLDRRQSEIAALSDQLKKGSATMSDDARLKLERDVDAKTKALNRDTEDASTDMEQDGNKVMGEVAGKMQQIVQNYAIQNGYAVVLDVSSQQNQVFWAAPSTNVTADVIKLYNDAHPVTAAAPAKPMSPPKPVPPPATKKQ
jgi:outer membrane protein